MHRKGPMGPKERIFYLKFANLRNAIAKLDQAPSSDMDDHHSCRLVAAHGRGRHCLIHTLKRRSRQHTGTNPPTVAGACLHAGLAMWSFAERNL